MIVAKMEVSNLEDFEKYEDMGLSLDNVPKETIDVHLIEDSISYFYTIVKEENTYIIVGVGGNELPIVYDQEVHNKLTQIK